eukprot:GHVS01080814.1.p1 GENE.GHVS01080814.1~~GHVS01080814.1.p1  ORF type:complete len:556 (+),score=140.00 GHVS01080814.1:49-1668(+)
MHVVRWLGLVVLFLFICQVVAGNDQEGSQLSTASTISDESTSFFSLSDVVACLLLGVACAAAVTVGVGGGGLFVPIMIMFMGFSPHQSTALSQCLMAGGTLSALLLNLTCTAHPDDLSKSVLDIQLILSLCPVQLAGVSVGVIVNRSLPAWVILLLMVVVLGFTAIRTWNKIHPPPLLTSQRQRQQQQRQQQRQQLVVEGGWSQARDVSAVRNFDEIVGGGVYVQFHDDDDDAAKQCELHHNDLTDNPATTTTTNSCCVVGNHSSSSSVCSRLGVAVSDGSTTSTTPTNSPIRTLPPSSVCNSSSSSSYAAVMSPQMCWVLLVALAVANAALLLARGGKARPGLVPFCGVWYWTLDVVNVLLLIAASIGIVLIASTHINGLSEDEHNDMAISSLPQLLPSVPSAFLLLLQTFLTGFIAAVVGIGGGMLLGPLLLRKGIHPMVVSAANATLILITSSAASFNFVVGGQAPLGYALTLGGVCFVAALLGKFLLDRLVMRHNLFHHVTYVLVVLIVLSMVSMLGSGIMELWRHGFRQGRVLC